MNKQDDLIKEQIRFFRLTNGLLSVCYMAGGIWMIVQVWNMIF